jgi:hypothetical protein
MWSEVGQEGKPRPRTGPGPGDSAGRPAEWPTSPQVRRENRDGIRTPDAARPAAGLAGGAWWSAQWKNIRD